MDAIAQTLLAWLATLLDQVPRGAPKFFISAALLALVAHRLHHVWRQRDVRQAHAIPASLAALRSELAKARAIKSDPVRFMAINNANLVSLLALGFGSLAGPNIGRYSDFIREYLTFAPEWLVAGATTLVFWLVAIVFFLKVIMFTLFNRRYAYPEIYAHYEGRLCQRIAGLETRARAPLPIAAPHLHRARIKPAVHEDVLRGHVAGILRAIERGRRAELLRRAEPMGRDALTVLLVDLGDAAPRHLGAPLRVGAQPVGLERPRQQIVDRDIVS